MSARVTGAAQRWVAARGVPRYVVVQSLGQNQGKGEVGDVQPRLEVVRDAVGVANQRLEADRAVGTDVIDGADGVYVRVDGVGAGVEKRAWLAALAEALGERGVGGVVDRPIRHHVSPAASEVLVVARPVSAVLVSTTRSRGRELAPRLRARYGGDATRAVFSADQAGIPMGVGAELDDLLQHNPADVITVRLENLKNVSRVIIGRSTAIAGMVGPEGWRDHVDLARRTLVEEAPGLLYGAARRAGTGASWLGLQQDPPEPPTSIAAGANFLRRPNNWPDQVLDVCGVQVVTPRHLDRAHDLSGWRVERLAGDRVLVEARDLAGWFEGPVPDPDVLARARVDFGRMIVTDEDVTTRMAQGLDPWPLP